MIKKVRELIVDKNTGKLKLNFIIALGIVGMLLILISGIDFSDEEAQTAANAALIADNTEDYRIKLQGDLEEILSTISGVGNVSVMISLEGTTEYVYAQQIESSSDVSEDKTSSEYRNELVMVDEKEGKNALVTKVLRPKVSGVLIVCDGGDDVVLTEKLINSAAAALGISTANICVARRTK